MTGALGRILDLIIVLWVLRMIITGLTGGSAARRARPSAPPGPSERAGGTLVRDPQCGTYLVESRALRVGSGSDAQYFCSATCRDAYRAAHSSVA